MYPHKDLDNNTYIDSVYNCLCISCLIIIFRYIQIMGFLCFLISGIIIYPWTCKIPSCASIYYEWTISILVIMGIIIIRLCIKVKKSYTYKTYAFICFTSSLIMGVISGLGYLKVILSSQDCDTSNISKIVAWTHYIVIFCTSLSCIYLLLAVSFYRLS